MRLLRGLGARVLALQAIEIRPGDRPGLARAARRTAAGTYDWIFLTSANGVRSARRILDAVRRMDPAVQPRLAAVGAATAETLRRAGLAADLVPAHFTSAAMLAAWKRKVLKSRGQRVLLLQPDLASEDLARGLAAAGADVERVSAYKTVRPSGLAKTAARVLARRRPDWVVLTSPSTAGNLAAALRGAGFSPQGLAAACIGPVTARAARRLGFAVKVRPAVSTVPALVQALAKAGQASDR